VNPGELTYLPDLIHFSRSFRSLSLELLDREDKVRRRSSSRGPVDASPICHMSCIRGNIEAVEVMPSSSAPDKSG